jgi:uncharacterized protein YbaR (Trm112 family)
MAFNFEALKDILVCPQSKAELVLEDDRLVSTDPDTRLSYEIRDGIPIMLIEEAHTLDVQQWAAIMQKHGRDAQTGKARDAN